MVHHLETVFQIGKTQELPFRYLGTDITRRRDVGCVLNHVSYAENMSEIVIDADCALDKSLCTTKGELDLSEIEH